MVLIEYMVWCGMVWWDDFFYMFIIIYLLKWVDW